MNHRNSLLPLFATALAFAACSSGAGGGATNDASNATASVVVPQTTAIASDGVEVATMEITLRDPSGAPMPGRTVTVSGSGSGLAFWPAAITATGADGRAVVQVSSTVAERKLMTVSGQVNGALTPLATDIPIDFADGERADEERRLGRAGLGQVDDRAMACTRYQSN